jgi:formylglycine-generating enzyme required for sulfatase activity
MQEPVRIICVLIFFSLVFIAGCNGFITPPETVLLGTWQFDSGGSEMTDWQTQITFTEDGRLLFGQPFNEVGNYVVIAPGKIKISKDGQTSLLNYQIDDPFLILAIDQDEIVFQRAENNFGSTERFPTGDQNTHNKTSTSTLFVPTKIHTLTLTKLLPTSTITLTPSPTAQLGIGSSMINSFDNARLVYVPAGAFLMGREGANAAGDEGPEHNVFLDAFWSHQHEVTNAQFGEFIRQTGYTTSAEALGKSWCFGEKTEQINGAYWAAPEGRGTTVEDRQDHPAVHISYEDAQRYCAWAGGRLPTEAEWEKAARGSDGRHYPWGESPNRGGVNYCDGRCPMSWADRKTDDGYARTSPVGRFPQGASPYDLMDMAGNVWEWTADRYNSAYYSDSPYLNPIGPKNGDTFVIRGGSWVSEFRYLTTTSRYWSDPADTSNDHGFRCVFQD